MDDIDITDSTFSLGNNFDENIVISQGGSSSFYMYIAMAVGILFICYILYNTFFEKCKKVTFHDNIEQCYGDICYPDK
jgi:hypothetical protein